MLTIAVSSFQIYRTLYHQWIWLWPRMKHALWTSTQTSLPRSVLLQWVSIPDLSLQYVTHTIRWHLFILESSCLHPTSRTNSFLSHWGAMAKTESVEYRISGEDDRRPQIAEGLVYHALEKVHCRATRRDYYRATTYQSTLVIASSRVAGSLGNPYRMVHSTHN